MIFIGIQSTALTRHIIGMICLVLFPKYSTIAPDRKVERGAQINAPTAPN